MEAATAVSHVSTTRHNSLVPEFRGIPKAALRTVFGKELGQQIWRLARAARPQARDAAQDPVNDADMPVESVPTKHGAPPAAAASGLADAEIVRGMIGYVSRRAAETLAQHKRQAKAIGLRLAYSDGVVSTQRTRLARPTSDAHELAAAAIDLFHAFEPRDVALESINLTTTTLQTEAVTDDTPQLAATLTPAPA
jgi:nucleotidyltransferase/DNA polymerase involved in DNA repair